MTMASCKSCGTIGPHDCPGVFSTGGGYCSPKEDGSSDNNGGATDYYRIKPEWSMLQDIIEERELNYSQGNILKVAFTLNTSRHSGTDYERDLNKLVYFAQRELDRIKGK